MLVDNDQLLAQPVSRCDISLRELDVEQRALAEMFYRSQGDKLRCGRSERLWVLQHPQQGIIAAARLLPYPNGYWLRNLLVVKSWRGQGLGQQLMQGILAGISPTPCYCFALPQVVDFYLRLGFVFPNPQDCPAELLARYTTYRQRGRDWVLMAYDHGIC